MRHRISKYNISKLITIKEIVILLFLINDMPKKLLVSFFDLFLNKSCNQQTIVNQMCRVNRYEFAIKDLAFLMYSMVDYIHNRQKVSF